MYGSLFVELVVVDVTDQVVENLVAYYAGHLEALLVGDRVDDHVAVDADEVLRVEDAVLVLKGSIAVSGGSLWLCPSHDGLEDVTKGWAAGL